jgi:hypothetical protein
MLIRKVYSDGLLAPGCTDHQESPTAIDVQVFAASRFGHDFASFFTNGSSISPASYESTEKSHKD